MPRRTKGRDDSQQPSTSSAFLNTMTYMDTESDSDGENLDQNFGMLVTNFAKYIINYSANKLPIKKNELVKALGFYARDTYPKVFKEAKAVLKDIYGLELVELAESKPTKLLITYSSFRLPTPLMLNSETSADAKILFIVLSYIFMKTGDVQEVNLNNFLEKLNINLDDFNKSKEKFCKQLYLKRRKVEIEGQNEPHFYYSWGERALLEFNKEDVLEAVAAIMKKPSTNFIVQHREVYGEDPNEFGESVMIE